VVQLLFMPQEVPQVRVETHTLTAVHLYSQAVEEVAVEEVLLYLE
jgi:hypothetical protein